MPDYLQKLTHPHAVDKRYPMAIIESMMSSLKPFFTYYGGKWRAAPKYPPPQYSTIVEPFAGSAGYSLRYSDRDIVLVDKDPNIVATWKYLINVSPSEIRSLPLLSKGDHLDTLDLSADQKRLLGWWVNPGSSQPKKTMGSFRGAWNESYRERIATQVSRIRHWTVIEGDCRDCADIAATWFIDPPYQEAGKYYRHGSKGIDFYALGDWCRSLLGQVIVCENVGADWLPFNPFITIKSNNSQADGRVSKEAIWYCDTRRLQGRRRRMLRKARGKALSS